MAVALACASPSTPLPPTPASTLVAGARLADGGGGPLVAADVRIEGGRIAEIGELERRPGDRVVRGEGLVLAPGFVDTHSHADDDLIDRPDSVVAALSQGITTVVVGQDGGSPFPLADFFARVEAAGTSINVASYTGHGTLRGEVMGKDFRRAARAEEVEAMARLLERELEAGALGLSSGLEYDPGIYAATVEVVALARVAAARGGRYISHLRSEDRRFWEAIDEIVTIGREAGLPVQISHLKLALRGLHGQTARLLATLDAARAEGVEVTADLYPYLYWQSNLGVLFPDRDVDDPVAAEFAVTEVSVPQEMLISRFEPEPALVGKTLAEIARLRGMPPSATLSALVRESQVWAERTGEDDPDLVIATSMSEADLAALMRWPHLAFCTDGSLVDAHPRGRGSFPRVLGLYVRERRVLSLGEAVRRMTSLAAGSVGLADRGRIEPGRHADLVLFDPERVRDRATTDEPLALSRGIEKVWVNGRLAYENGALTAERAGRVLRRPVR